MGAAARFEDSNPALDAIEAAALFKQNTIIGPIIIIIKQRLMDSTATFYSQPSYVSSGGAFPVFAGGRRQRGGGIFGSLARMVLPALKSVGKSVLKSAGQQALGLATEVAQSALSGEGLSGVKQTLQRQGL